MKKGDFISWPWLMLAIGLIAPSCQATRQEDLVAVARGNNDFSARLYDAVRQSNNESFIVSPISICTAMAMLQAGARGETADDIRTIFGFLEEDEQTYIGYQALLQYFNSSEIVLEMANKVFPMEGYKLSSEFTETAKDYFNSEPQQLDYTKPAEAAETINRFVSGATQDRIQNLLGPGDVDEFTRLVLVNAIYFKGAWKTTFPIENTKKMDFYTSETEKVSVDMMRLEVELLYGENYDLNAKIVSLPYKGDTSMIILLPNNRTGLAALEEQLKNYSLDSIMEKMGGRQVELYLPKFKLESTINLQKPLEKLGLESLFSADTANFTGIPAEELKETERLYVSKVIQKAFIEVDEEGSEAAAATGIAVAVELSAIFPLVPPVTLLADHPFSLVIASTVEREGDVDGTSFVTLFQARVQNPVEN